MHQISTTTGAILHRAAGYDLLVWLVTLGRERAFRERVLRLAAVQAGESVLDVGCGTGTLAIAAARHVGATGRVVGVDASPDMIARARRKAAKAGVHAIFEEAIAEALPFRDAQFDVVLATMMLHHLPRNPRRQCVAEMRRVLKPDGRMLAVDFGKPPSKDGRFVRRFHPHGHIDVNDLITVLNEAGLTVVESGAARLHNLYFVRATPAAST
jgi:ubiquinone/menaquinone biosynthesis C-methylase UbiE